MKVFRHFTFALCLVTSLGFATAARADDTPPVPSPKPGSVQVSVTGPALTVSLTEILLENYFLLIQAWLI
jgi:hypothetical protein